MLAAEEALEGALKDLSDDSMSLLTTVYEILDVINLLEPDMVEDTTRVELLIHLHNNKERKTLRLNF